jgi:hypothetical protein
MDSSPAFFQRFDKLCRHLKGLGVPKAYWPVVHVRIVETTNSAWVTWEEHQRQEHRRNNTPTVEPPMGTTALNQSGPKSWGEITPRQVARVRSNRHSLSDPCVICGSDFSECPHSTTDTELFIAYVRQHYAPVRGKQ